MRIRYVFGAIRSVFIDEKKLSIAALPFAGFPPMMCIAGTLAYFAQTLPDRLIEQVTPLSAINRWNCSLVYWLPWSE